MGKKLVFNDLIEELIYISTIQPDQSVSAKLLIDLYIYKIVSK